MRTVPHRSSVRHELFELPLLQWSASRDVALTPGGNWVHRRFQLPRGLANVVAELAGIGSEPTR
jgi:hypothetical protein